MSVIIGLDPGKKRTGIAITDELKIVASAYKTVNTSDLIPELEDLNRSFGIDHVVLGFPVDLQGHETDGTPFAKEIHQKIKNRFPDLKVSFSDEQFTSRKAMEILVQSNVPKKKRQDKSLLDKVSATLILQSFLETETS